MANIKWYKRPFKWYYKKSEKIIEASVNEYLGYGFLVAIFGALFFNLWETPALISTKASTFSQTASQYGLSISVDLLIPLIWFVLLSGAFIVLTMSWVIYKLFFRTKINRYVKKLKAQEKSLTRAGKKKTSKYSLLIEAIIVGLIIAIIIGFLLQMGVL